VQDGSKSRGPFVPAGGCFRVSLKGKGKTGLRSGRLLGDKVQGNLILIGGAEDKDGECLILRRFIDLASTDQGISLVILTSASTKADVIGEDYRRVFARLGVAQDKISVLNIESRVQAEDKEQAGILERATGIFFTGGDQLRITSLLGGTLIDRGLHGAYKRGVVIAGTSAGASVMSTTMIVSGSGDNAPRKGILSMAPGMGLLGEVVVDQHFAQRGRIGRLLAAVAQNPYILGIGLDEDTAIAVSSRGEFEVVGTQTVTIVDGSHISHSNVSELREKQPLAIAGVDIHVLPHGYRFDMASRCPII